MTAERPSHRSTLNPMMWLLVSFAAGIVLGEILDLQPFILASTGAVLIVLAVMSSRRNATWLCLVSFFVLGAFCSELESGSIASDRLRRIYDDSRIRSGDPVSIVGSVVGSSEPSYDGEFIEFNTRELVHRGERITSSGKLRIYLPVTSDEARKDANALGLRHGDTVRFTCAVEREDRFLNPGVTLRREMLDRQGIDATCTVKSPLLIEVLDRTGFGPFRQVFEVRRSLIHNIRELFEPKAAGVLIASSLGNKYFLDRNTAEVFREGGTFHILVISGLHITFIGGILLLVVRRFARNRVIQFVISSSVLWTYTIAVGAEAPAVRASVMFTAVLFALVAFRSMTLVNAFGASGLVLLILRPSDLFDPSFQLTFASVGGIVLMAFPVIEKLRAIGVWMPSSTSPFPPNVAKWLRMLCETVYWNPSEWKIDQTQQVWKARIRKRPFIDGLSDIGLRRPLVFAFEGIIVSVIVQLWMLPFLVWYFHRVSFASILLNLWAGPLLAVESFTAIAALALAKLDNLLAVPFVRVTEILNDALLWVPSAFVEHGWASYRLPAFTGDAAFIYLIYFIPIASAAYIVSRWEPFTLIRPKLILTAIRLSVLTLVFVWFLLPVLRFGSYSTDPIPDGKLTIRFLDVGQGDAAFIVFPNGESMLIDGGGRVNYGRDDGAFEPDVARIGETVVSETIWELGFSRIDHLVASHADTDHIQGLVDAAKNFDIGRAYFASIQGRSSDEAELTETLSRNRVDIRRLNAGETIEIGGVRVDVLHPSSDEDADMGENDRSLVLLFTHGARRFLFTGDIEAAAEEKILGRFPVQTVDVVKVPHHGSRTSSSEAFVGALQPEMAIIPVGRRSNFGHPHYQPVEMWKTYGADVMTTGENGMITIRSDGNSLQINIFPK